MNFIVIIEETTGLPQMLNIAEIISIFANTKNSPPTTSFVVRGSAIIHSTTLATITLTKALSSGIAADLRP